MKKNNEMTIEETGTSFLDEPNTEQGLSVVNQDNQLDHVSITDIDALDEAEVAPIDLSVFYWTPVNKGENKRVIFQKIGVTQVLDQQSGELIDLEVAFFATKENGVARMICNGSKRLVGQIVSNKIPSGTPLLLTYNGKIQNKNNGFKSDDWSCSPLILKK